jgi:Protein of unknown function (DUF1059)
MANTSTTPTIITRKFVDCRELPSQLGCTLRISGRPDEVLLAAKHHAITVHGEKDSPELLSMIRRSMKDDR